MLTLNWSNNYSRFLCLIAAGCCSVVGWILTPVSSARSQNQEPVLAFEQTYTRTIAPDERHIYQVHLEIGQFVLFELWQRETVAYVRIYNPKGESIYHRLRTGTPSPRGGLHAIRLVVETAGVYRLELIPWRVKTPGQYDLTWLERRPAKDEDRNLQDAAKALDVAGVLQSRYDVGSLAERRLIREQQEFDQALSAGEQSLVTYQRLLPKSPDVGNLAIVLANLYGYRGYYGDTERIEQLWEIAVKNRELLLGTSNGQIPALYQVLGKTANPVRAEQWFRKAVALSEEQYGAEDLLVAVMLGDLAANLKNVGELGRAAEISRRLTLIVEKWLSDASCLADLDCKGALAATLVTNGTFSLERGVLEEAERYLQQARLIWANPEVPDLYKRKADLVAQLGHLFEQKGDFAQAESYFRQLIALEEKSSHPLSLGQAWRQLGNLYITNGKYPEAAMAFEHAKVLLEKTGQPMARAQLYRDWRKLHLATGQLEAALLVQQQAVEITESNLSHLLVSTSEWEKLKLLGQARDETNETLNLHSQNAPDSPAALRLAFTTWLQRKARVQDEMSRTVGLLRNSLNPELLPLLNDLLNKQSQLARLATVLINEKDRAAQYEQLNRELEQLQRTLGERSLKYRVQTQSVTLEAVQASLPAGSALVDFARVESYDEQTKQSRSARYFAYILLPQGLPQWVDLGEEQAINRAVEAWRKALDLTAKTTQIDVTADARTLARKLDALVMQPVRARLGQAKQVFLAPDGMLNHVPFAALVDEHNQELVRNYLFIYLTCGRDLLRFNVPQVNNDAVLVFAAPDYNDGSGQGATLSDRRMVADDRRGVLSRSRSAVGLFEPLANAEAEANVIKKLWPQAQLFTGKKALERVLKEIQHPQILHVVTHGVFLEDQQWESGRAGEVSRVWENPLLRSWLALAGANQRQQNINQEDGILTAYEVAALDLWGTKLVVLSACETGLGAIKNGEGVYGLRRALVLAGAETQVTSLWRVDDEVTKELMSAYYRKLRSKVGRAIALQQVQLQMLRGRDRAQRHPYYWAGFIQLGEWANLDGDRPPSFGVQRTKRKE